MRNHREIANSLATANVIGSSPRRSLVYRRAFCEAVTPETVREIVASLIARAKAGDVAAARLVLERALPSGPVAEWPAEAAVERDARLEDFFS